MDAHSTLQVSVRFIRDDTENIQPELICHFIYRGIAIKGGTCLDQVPLGAEDSTDSGGKFLCGFTERLFIQCIDELQDSDRIPRRISNGHTQHLSCPVSCS